MFGWFLRMCGAHGSVLTALLLGFQASALPRYHASHLNCAVFRETVTGDIRGEAGRTVRRERLGRNGVLIAWWPPDSTNISIWFDSLHVWREDSTARVEPDTEGLLGGRWIGRLTPTGEWSGEQIPFVPDEVAAVQDLRMFAGDFFPVPPRVPLKVGAADTSLGRTIKRERNQGSTQRYTWTLERKLDTVAALDDTLEAEVSRELKETGSLLWNGGRGPLEWERTVITEIRPRNGSRRARGVVVQRIRVTRLADSPGCGG